MSRPKRRTPESDKFVHEQALYRVDMLSNKQIAHALAQMGVNITPNYVGELVKQAERRIREDRELSRRAKVSRETIRNVEPMRQNRES